MTTLEEERSEQARWRLRPRFQHLRQFDELVDNEFAAPEQQAERQARDLNRIVRFAASQVPYYRELFSERGLQAADIGAPGDLPLLPLLSKRTLYERSDALQPGHLPPGERPWGWFSSSGTTGRPARVLQTRSSNAMFTYLNQRQWRWFRFDPRGKLAHIRLASQLPRLPGGRQNPDGHVIVAPGWRYVGTFFETGESVYFNVTNPVDRQAAWLVEHQPDYLIAYSESLEHLAFAAAGRFPAHSIRGLLAISEQLTDEMRTRIERSFAAPVRQNYGLNEVGIVAARCEAGRYHVHTEHCLVEVVDEAGQPCAAGQVGRLVVTALRNAAMPLIRYDTDDLATALDGPCPCGRTLPTFGELVGRYSRIAYLPDGTLGLVGVLRGAVEAIPDALTGALRQFQIYQYRDGRFEVRLARQEPLATAVHEHIRAAWQRAGHAGIPLQIVELERIPRGPGGKHQEFLSEHYPAAPRRS